MPARPRAVPSGLAPGTDSVSLWVITGMVLAGLILTGLRVAQGVPAAGTTGAALLNAAQGPAGPRAGGAAGLGKERQQGQETAVSLLKQAAAASRADDYQGVETLAWHGPRGLSTAVAQVWHISGAPALTGLAAGALGAPPDTYRAPPPPADDAVGLDSSGALVLSQQLASVLAANYSLAVTGRGLVAGRQARVLTVRRADGGLAARIWLDAATHLPLRRQVFGPHAAVISDAAFAAVSFGPRAVASAPGAPTRPWGHQLAPAVLEQMRAGGWPLPGRLPGHLELLSAREQPTGSGPVVELDYSDGLSMVSILVQRGHLPPRLEGWSPVAMAGHRVYADDPDDANLAWSARGYVYTVISAASTQTVGKVVAALPHDGPVGLLARIDRGLRRLLSYLRP